MSSMDAASLRRGSGSKVVQSQDDAKRNTPLKLFVDAKKKINEIFTEISAHVQDTVAYLECMPEGTDIVTEEQHSKVQNVAEQVKGIKEVLCRDHMKVAFFGRTSNGKSSVINAMLRDKVLPTGLGHTTNCFLHVEGSETDEAYLLTPGSEEKLNVGDTPLSPQSRNLVRMSVESVSHLAHALADERMDESSVVKVFWPKSRCMLLQNDVVLLDSPGIDVEEGLDEWINSHCMDADVFVLVSNAESTLMRTEKSFFHKVSQKLSKPNIFILNNRWDASASEPEYMEAVKKQHLKRNIQFLSEELGVVDENQAKDRVFFVSAKEALRTRCPKVPNTPDAGSFQMAEGYQARLFEFENFERQFQECISQTAVQTKFEQHAKQGKLIASMSQEILQQVTDDSEKKRSSCIEKRKEQMDRLEYMNKQMKLLSHECKESIKDVVDKAEQRVSTAISDEIERLFILVDQFHERFSSDELVIKVYKEKLQEHLELGLDRNLHASCSGSVMTSVDTVQKTMIERMSALLPDESKAKMSGLLFRKDFGLSYRLDCKHLFADFKENIEFQFSLGLTALMNRFLGPSGTKAALVGFANVIPSPMPPAGSDNRQASSGNEQELAVAMMTGLASLASKTSVGLMVIAGVVWRGVGWKILAVAGGLYLGIYAYERLTWTNRAKEKVFKKQFVEYASEKLRVLVNFTSSNLSHQIQQELSGTFSRLALEVDTHKDNLQKETEELQVEAKKLEELIRECKTLKNKAGWLQTELDHFIRQYIPES